MTMNAVENGKLPPIQASRVQPLDFSSDAARLVLAACKLHDADFFAVTGLCDRSSFLQEQEGE